MGLIKKAESSINCFVFFNQSFIHIIRAIPSGNYISDQLFFPPLPFVSGTLLAYLGL